MMPRLILKLLFFIKIISLDFNIYSSIIFFNIINLYDCNIINKLKFIGEYFKLLSQFRNLNKMIDINENKNNLF